MPSITALLHTENDALRLGRALETLYTCDDILIVDYGSRDATVRVARESVTEMAQRHCARQPRVGVAARVDREFLPAP